MKYPPLDEQDKPVLTTDEAAHYLNRRPQTLRGWSSTEHGPVKPILINGRLGWPTDQVKRVLKVGQFQ